jgi:hypothetical protein
VAEVLVELFFEVESMGEAVALEKMNRQTLRYK